MKKSFKDISNPALQFISSAQPQESSAELEAPITETSATPTAPRRPAATAEVKSRRVQLVFQPSLYKKVKKAAKGAGLSVNEYVHQILERETKGV